MRAHTHTHTHTRTHTYLHVFIYIRAHARMHAKSQYNDFNYGPLNDYIITYVKVTCYMLYHISEFSVAQKDY